MTPSDFGKNPNNLKKFSQPFDPIGYNYWDYMQAWTNVFWMQNQDNKHSWLLYFKRNTHYKFPHWFANWWDFFGPIKEILPEETKEGFNFFMRRIKLDLDPFPVDLHFFSKFSLSWILSWQYKLGKSSNQNRQPLLQRQAFVKWWSKSSQASVDQVKTWFTKNPKWLEPINPEASLFLNQRSHITAALASSSNKEDLTQNLEAILKLLKEDQEAQGSSSSEAFDENEDMDKHLGFNLDEDEDVDDLGED